MNNKLALSIAITSLASIGTVSLPLQAADNAPAPQTEANKTPPKSHGGKCASGKCGTEKIYSKVALDKNPQDRLVRTRDGKCGLSAKGHDVKLTPRNKLAEGVCGQ
jgi:uncharacterized low-complexity protein